MPKHTYSRCKGCRRPREETGPLSHTRLCERCAYERLYANNLQIHHKNGPYYERRIYGMVRAELGPRVALALKQAGYFSVDPDAPITSG